MNKHQESLAKDKIWTLLFKQSSPAVIGLVIMSLYNMVDTIFIGRFIGKLGIAGLSISFPIQIIIMGIGHTIGIGTSSIISRALGSKDYKKAEKSLGNAFVLIIIFAVLISISGHIFLEPLLKLFGATETIMPYSIEYMRVILFGTVFAGISPAFNHIIRSEGNAKFAMKIISTAAIINIILDPIFIFGLDMGMSGAALATILAQMTSSSLAIYYVFSSRNAFKLYLKDLKLDLEITKETLSIGFSTFARQISTSVELIIVNNALAKYGGDIGIASYGIINRVWMLILMPMFGLVQGVQPMIGYNFGAKEYKRVKESIKASMITCTILSTLGFFLILCFSESIINIFTTDLELIAVSSKYVKIASLMLPLVGFQVIAGGMYQSMGKAMKALLISTLRQVVLLIPLLIILPRYFESMGVWMSFPISDFLASIFTGILVAYEFRKLTNLEKHSS